MGAYLGRNQIAECQRCGQKGLAKDLMPDGRNPQLLVFRDCYDPAHPQEEPFRPKENEGKAPFHIAPENLPPSLIVLDGSFDGDAPAWEPDSFDAETFLAGTWSEGGGAVLLWSRPTTQSARFERYEIFRATADTTFTLIGTNEIEYNDFGVIINNAESFTDVNIAGESEYYVEAVAGTGHRTRSNTIVLDVV